MSHNEVKTENKEARWEELTNAYKTAAQTYAVATSYLTNIYKKYKPIIDKNPNIKLILDGGSNTLIGIKKMIDGLALSHIEPATEEDEKNNVEVFKGKDGKLMKFKSGVINDEDDELIKSVIKTLIAYSNISGNIFIVTKNTISALVIDLEKVINDIEDEEEREKYLKLLDGDKEELEIVGKEEAKEGEEDGKPTDK